jgi:hypothetical protein
LKINGRSGVVAYYLQFFRQWSRDVGVEDIKVEGSLDHARALAQATLQTLARERTSRFRPRTTYIIDADTRELVIAYRLTDDGPVELPPISKPLAKPVPVDRLTRTASAAG